MLCFALHVRKLQLSEHSLVALCLDFYWIYSNVLGVLASHWKEENLDVLRQK